MPETEQKKHILEQADQILATFMAEDKEQGIFFSLPPVLTKHYPRLTPAKAVKLLDRLEEKGFIKSSARKTKGVPDFIQVTASAYAYFEEKEAKRLAVRQRQPAEFTLHPIEAAEPEPRPGRLKFALYYVFGVLSGAALMWVKLAK